MRELYVVVYYTQSKTVGKVTRLQLTLRLSFFGSFLKVRVFTTLIGSCTHLMLGTVTKLTPFDGSLFSDSDDNKTIRNEAPLVEAQIFSFLAQGSL